MIYTSLFQLLIQVRPYGTNSLFYYPLLRPKLGTRTSHFLIESLLLQFLQGGLGSSGAPLNRYFFFLINQKKAYKIDYHVASFFTYNFSAIELFKGTLNFMHSQIRRRSRLLFIADKKTNKLFHFKRLNYVFWPAIVYPSLDALGDIEFYYNTDLRATVYKLPAFKQGFDCVFFCAQDYSRLNVTSFKSIGRATLGVCGADTRPDLFDYTLPVTSTYNFTVSWLISLTFLLYTDVKTF